MKQLSLILISLFLVQGIYCQSLSSAAIDSLVIRVIERCIYYEYSGVDSVGIIYLQVTKKGDSLKVKTLYNSLKQYLPQIERSINDTSKWKYIQPIPDKYSSIVPIYINIETKEEEWSFLTQEQKLVAETKVKKQAPLLRILRPITYYVYRPSHSTAYNTNFPK